jgi:signal transduction histidine kinase
MTAGAIQEPMTSLPGRLPKVRSERGAILALIVVFWLAFQAVFFTYGTLSAEDQTVSASTLLQGLLVYLTRPAELAIIAVGAAICFAVYLILRRVRRIALWQQLMTAVLAAVASAACFSMAVSALLDWFGLPWPAITPRFLIVDTLRWFAPFGLWAGFAMTVTYNSEMRERDRRLAVLQASAKDAQMRALRYQVNPHLLYNTLNSIAALILDRQNELAEAMVVRLSNFFRASLANDPLADVPLSEEIALQRLYLEIEQIRFPRFSAEFDIPDELGQVQVPSLILQPLMENTLKHGLNPNGERTQLVVRARGAANKLVIEVSDDGPGTSLDSGTGVGLSNVRRRLASRFGDDAALEIESRPRSGHLVRLIFPARCS